MEENVNVHLHASTTPQRHDSEHGRPRYRRHKRMQETQEIRVRTSHRRRTILTRGGVLAGFGLAMLVYPIMGNVIPYASAVEEVPGVIVGEAPSTAHALLGRGPQLVESSLAAPTVDEVASAIAVSDRYTVSQYLPDCDPTGDLSGSNGKLAASALCDVAPGVELRADAAVAWAEMNAAFKVAFGRDMCVGEGYRSLAKQYATKRSRGYLAATPGTSVHGWGLAFDLCGTDDSGAAKRWLDTNAETWGWVNPAWAKTRKWEPWHWEYEPATDAMDLYGSGYYGADGTSD